MARQYEEVGRVHGLSRFPFKSMSGEAIQESRIGWHGIEGDRRFAILKTTDKSGFPWFTCRDYPPLVQYRAYYVDPGNLRDSAIQVKTPAGHDLPVGSPELLEELQQHSKTPLQLIQLWSGIFDAMDISVISVESIKSVEVMVGGKLDERRFRSNITIETTPFLTREFPEEKFVGGLLKFGDRDDSVTIRVKRKDVRCMVVNVDPETATQDPAVLKQIVAQRKNQLGVYGSTERPGIIKVGDEIRWCKE